MEWKKVERHAHDFKENPEVIGEVVEKPESQFGGVDFVLKTKGGEVLVYGKTALQTKMANIKPGTMVKIVLLGERKSEKTGRTYEDFEVFTAK